MKKNLAAAVLALLLTSFDAHGAATVEGDNTGAVAGADISNSVGSSTISMMFESARQQPYIPGTIAAPVVSPTLFNVLGKPAQIAGLPVLSQYFFSTAVHRVGRGQSGSTKVIFNSANMKPKKPGAERKIMFDFNGVTRGRVVGSLTVQSLKNRGDEVDLPTVIYDATHYIGCVDDLKGHDLLLLSYPDLISFGVGVDAKSNGLSLSPVVSGLINGPAGVLAGLASGLSSTGGVTVPTAIVGCTFLIVVQDEEQHPIDLARCFGKSVAGVQMPELKENGEKPIVPEKNGSILKKKEYEATKP